MRKCFQSTNSNHYQQPDAKVLIISTATFRNTSEVATALHMATQHKKYGLVTFIKKRTKDTERSERLD